MAGFYQKAFDRLPRFLRRRIHPLQFAIDEFVLQAAGRTAREDLVLDAGAGEGRFRPFFAEATYWAVDAGVGDETWDYSELDFVADLQRLPIVSGCFDLIVNTQVLEHLPHPGRAIAEFHRALTPGGRLYLTAPQGWHEHQQPHDYFRFTRFSLEQLLREGGFDEFSVEPMGGFFHYLGHRLTYIPKILFWGRRSWVRLALLPLELICLLLFCFVAPLLCYYLDRLDRNKEFTLGYRVTARRRNFGDRSSSPN